MKSSEERELATLKTQRDRLRREIRSLDHRTGDLAAQILSGNSYASKSSIGRVLGISHTQVSNLIDSARIDSRDDTAQPGIPVMDNTVAGDYVLGSGSQIRRSVSAFTESDTLFQTGLDPRLFADESGRLDVPDVMWQLDDGSWIGVSMATVGYGGTGCGLTQQALMRAGVDPDIAAEIVSYRFCDADLAEDPSNWDKSHAWPRHQRTIPRVLGNKIVIPFGEALRELSPERLFEDPPLNMPEIDESGFYPSKRTQTPFAAWISFLNQASGLPDWATGQRVARVFRSEEAAAEDGFAITPRFSSFPSRNLSPCIVIEQGDVQLWGYFYRNPGDTSYLPDEGYEALAIADIYPTGLQDHDRKAARPLIRFARLSLGFKDGLPDRIDISPNADQHLSFTPSGPIEY